MATDLDLHVDGLCVVDTHEHLNPPGLYPDQEHDPLRLLFDNYFAHDLVSAGATPGQVHDELFNPGFGGVAERFAVVAPFWERAQHTGYGRAVKIMARDLFGIERVGVETMGALEAAARALTSDPDWRLRLLRDRANLDHVQCDRFDNADEPAEPDKGFFRSDISWVWNSRGEVDFGRLMARTGVEVTGAASAREAIAEQFRREAPGAVALKSQHAYARTLLWANRTDAEVEALIERRLRGEDLVGDDRLVLGDWMFARGIEGATDHGLPVKIHTGYLAGNGGLWPTQISPSNLGPLLVGFPEARFVLMHVGYPEPGQVVQLAKHYRNTWIDMCWAWSIDPVTSRGFVASALAAVPANKILAFGGDSLWATASYAYSVQARRELAGVLGTLVADGTFDEGEAIGIATRLLRENALDLFPTPGL
ncbi:amidohydrolase family protein [Mucisphaera calidilacus]|uniref:Amidohydrolase n=1 Tax=Mucisphaera calidilacus TaxID=2527982 RepID=A0A518BWT1_9BACT|nr:amidohydrolase family protein [Mucisphaera calidilacus]QDU71432.1 Amidohydrolase [Mucisphaera calidilacus]